MCGDRTRYNEDGKLVGVLDDNPRFASLGTVLFTLLRVGFRTAYNFLVEAPIVCFVLDQSVANL